MDEGKLKLPLLKELLKLSGSKNKGIVLSGKIGSDVAIIDIELAKDKANEFYNENSDVYLIEKSDPITFPTSEPGKHVIIVNSNDIACSGALPYGFLSTIIVPKSMDYEEIHEIQEQMHEQCKKQNIAILGGHTEISSSVNSIILSGHMFGFVPKAFLIQNKLSLDEKIIAIGYTGAEGTGIIIKEGGKRINRILDKDEIKEGRRIGSNINITELALELNRRFRPSLIHDATEGGVYGALSEIVAYTDVGIILEDDAPISCVTKKLAERLNFNPYRLISSGAIILSTNREKALDVVEYCKLNDIPCKIIGTVTKSKGEIILDNITIEKPDGDAIIKALEELEKIEDG
ncbi:MAG: hypothetical protein H7647_02465 [Candidatus Heimdallarchaeota archaeon]|nr:hypothetical protein [Candidatus Heimdallarchaeota archaeon]MCK4253291.1 hypothetical protein [Candidatus Heimdallarchaeota archaeon]